MLDATLMVAGASVSLSWTVNHPDPFVYAIEALKPDTVSWLSVEIATVWVGGFPLPIVSLKVTVAGFTWMLGGGGPISVVHAPFQNAAPTHRTRAPFRRLRIRIVAIDRHLLRH